MNLQYSILILPEHHELPEVLSKTHDNTGSREQKYTFDIINKQWNKILVEDVTYPHDDWSVEPVQEDATDESSCGECVDEGWTNKNLELRPLAIVDPVTGGVVT